MNSDEENFENLKLGFKRSETGFFRCFVPDQYAHLIEIYAKIEYGDIANVVFGVKVRQTPRTDKLRGEVLCINICGACHSTLESPNDEQLKSANDIIINIERKEIVFRRINGIPIPTAANREGVAIRFDISVNQISYTDNVYSAETTEAKPTRSTFFNIGGDLSLHSSRSTEYLSQHDRSGFLLELYHRKSLLMRDYMVFDKYYRYDAKDRASCDAIIKTGNRLLSNDSDISRTMLIWSKSGMGKSSLIKQIASTIQPLANVSVVEMNCARCNSEDFLVKFIEQQRSEKGVRIVLFDEADAQLVGANFLYKHLMPFLELRSKGPDRFLSIMIASTGVSVDEVATSISNQFKGPDVLGRVSMWNRVNIPVASLGDKAIAFAAGVLGDRREVMISKNALIAAAQSAADLRGAVELGVRTVLRCELMNRPTVNLIDIVEDDVSHRRYIDSEKMVHDVFDGAFVTIFDDLD